jgi:hypothetical protein
MLGMRGCPWSCGVELVPGFKNSLNIDEIDRVRLLKIDQFLSNSTDFAEKSDKKIAPKMAELLNHCHGITGVARLNKLQLFIFHEFCCCFFQ